VGILVTPARLAAGADPCTQCPHGAKCRGGISRLFYWRRKRSGCGALRLLEVGAEGAAKFTSTLSEERSRE
jgi:hypothetical protein